MKGIFIILHGMMDGMDYLYMYISTWEVKLLVNGLLYLLLIIYFLYPTYDLGQAVKLPLLNQKW